MGVVALVNSYVSAWMDIMSIQAETFFGLACTGGHLITAISPRPV